MRNTLVNKGVLISITSPAAPPHASLDWFSRAGFGVFIHFGHAASRGWELSWQMTGGVEGQHPPRPGVPVEEYFDNAYAFDPASFDAVQWADAIANSGATYAVFTSKHHDGFSMFDTAHSDYSITRASPFGRDLMRELLDALRQRGIRTGVYFSLPDWHHPLYPAMTEETITRPYELGSYVRTDAAQWGQYRAFMLAQLTEILTEYGQIDLLWFDGEFEHTAAEWDYAGIREHVRALQPDCVVNDRCVGFGDYTTVEQRVPTEIPKRQWEASITMNDSWGWSADDRHWKSTATLLGILAEVVAAGGNLLLNVGPTGDGLFPREATERLEQIGEWTSRNREAMSGVSRAPAPMRAPLPIGVKASAGIERVFVYCTLRPHDTVIVAGLPVSRILNVSVLGTDISLAHTGAAWLSEVHAGVSDPLGDLEIIIPQQVADSLVPVLEVTVRTSSEV
ncbi:alpha-L-fucosidase [Microbacterium marmarense]|uniref:alpha-L-fucosidase n=1 Tax=Microbacterium marmarense TaxID=3122051 RepID=A0ABU8LRH9_9MICO